MLNISKSLYAAWHTQTQDLPEAELTPVGESVSEKRKINRITNSTSTYKEIDNKPFPGFTLYKAKRRGYTGGDSWLVIDPRGFLVRITSKNLERLLSETGITEGLIQEKCVWAREDSETKLSLIPISSDEYIEAVKNTELIENKVSKDDIAIGDIVMLQCGLTGKYMGTESLYGPIFEKWSGKSSISKPRTFLRRQIIEVAPNRFYFQTDLKILKVNSKSTTSMTRAESVKYMNDSLANGAVFTQNPGFDFANTNPPRYNYNAIIAVSSDAVSKPTITLEEITKDEAKILLSAIHTSQDLFQLIVEDSFKRHHTITYATYIGKNPDGSAQIKFSADQVDQVVNGCTEIKLQQSSRRYYNRTYMSVDDYPKFYRVVKHIKNTTYF